MLICTHRQAILTAVRNQSRCAHARAIEVIGGMRAVKRLSSAMDKVLAEDPKDGGSGSSPVGRGGAGTYIEGELGAFYLLQMLAGSEARGLPDARIERVQFQGVDDGYALDDLIVHGVSELGSSLLEIQSKRTITLRWTPSIGQETG